MSPTMTQNYNFKLIRYQTHESYGTELIRNSRNEMNYHSACAYKSQLESRFIRIHPED